MCVCLSVCVCVCVCLCLSVCVCVCVICPSLEVRKFGCLAFLRVPFCVCMFVCMCVCVCVCVCVCGLQTWVLCYFGCPLVLGGRIFERRRPEIPLRYLSDTYQIPLRFFSHLRSLAAPPLFPTKTEHKPGGTSPPTLHRPPRTPPHQVCRHTNPAAMAQQGSGHVPARRVRGRVTALP